MPTLEVERSKFKLPAWAKLLGAFVLVSGLTAAGSGIWQWRLAADQKDYKAAISNENWAGLTKNYASAVAGWEKYRNGWPPRSYQYEAAMHEGELRETMKDLPGALKMYRIAEAHRKGNGTAEYTGIARISEQLGDYPTAVAYYQKAADLYKSYHKDADSYYAIMGQIQILKQKEQANAGK